MKTASDLLDASVSSIPSQEGILLRPAGKPPIELYTEDRIAEFARDEEAVGELLPTRE